MISNEQIHAAEKMTIVNTPLIPREVIFGNPEKAMVTLSPNGKYIAYIAPKDGVLNIWVAPSNDPSKAKAITNDQNRGIRNYSWAYNNEHVLYMQDEKGNENFRIYSYNLTTSQTKLLTPQVGVRAFIAATSYKYPNEILIGSNERDQRYFDILKINLQTAKQETVLENNKFNNFTTDEELNIRFARISNPDNSYEYFELKNGQWEPFINISPDDTSNTGLYGFDKTGSILYMSDSRGRNTAAIVAIDLKTQKTTIIAEDDKSDIGIFTSHPTEHTIQAIITNYDTSYIKIIDNSIKKDIEYLQSLMRGNLIINSRTLDDKEWLVAYESDISPIKYYKYNRDLKKADYLFSNRPKLEQYSLAKMHPVIIKSRDGLNLISYLTLPFNNQLNDKLQTQQPLPLILYVHGGPALRDSWGYDPTHQWLANRGYAILSVNYRGSTGFGKDFTNAGNREWGKKMHDDLIDAANWAIDSKIADPKKVAIMGGSYGGYATLIGLTLTPDIFACGVDLVGPSNLLTLVNSIPPYWQPIISELKRRIGPWDTKEEQMALREISPLTHVKKIKKPLFIAQGAHDPRVKQAESDQIVEEMQSKNIPVIYALYNDEGHGFARPENRKSYYALVEQFLAKILGGQAEPIGSDLDGANLLLNGTPPKNSAAAENIIEASIRR